VGGSEGRSLGVGLSADPGSGPQRVDEKLTELRDGLPLVGQLRSRSRRTSPHPGHMWALTWRHEPVGLLFDAEEARDSNPLAPTKTAGQRPFSSCVDLFLGAEECLSQRSHLQSRWSDAMRMWGVACWSQVWRRRS
jgi:hypothetical protein